MANANQGTRVAIVTGASKDSDYMTGQSVMIDGGILFS